MFFVFQTTFLYIKQRLFFVRILTYSPLMHSNSNQGKKVAILGLVELGHMGVKIAYALGAKVTVISHSLKKQEEGKNMGADKFYATS